MEKLLAQRKMITSALSAVKRDGESKLVLLQAQLNRTYSSDIAVCQSSQHEKSSWLEAQSTSLKQRIAQVQCEIDVSVVALLLCSFDCLYDVISLCVSLCVMLGVASNGVGRQWYPQTHCRVALVA